MGGMIVFTLRIKLQLPGIEMQGHLPVASAVLQHWNEVFVKEETDYV